MALIVCPECQQQMSDTAHACPRCGWARAAVMAAAQRSASSAEGQKLVSLSTKLLACGLLVMLAGCGVSAASNSPAGFIGGVVLGLVVLTVAAVVGQIGRAKQGRVL